MKTIKNYRTAARLIIGAAVAATFLALPLASQAAVYFYTDLNPSGPGAYSLGWGISGSQQAGEGAGSETGGGFHALLWSGTASSVVDLNPSGFDGSAAYGISGSQQVGFGSSAGAFNHA